MEKQLMHWQQLADKTCRVLTNLKGNSTQVYWQRKVAIEYLVRVMAYVHIHHPAEHMELFYLYLKDSVEHDRTKKTVTEAYCFVRRLPWLTAN